MISIKDYNYGNLKIKKNNIMIYYKNNEIINP